MGKVKPRRCTLCLQGTGMLILACVMIAAGVCEILGLYTDLTICVYSLCCGIPGLLIAFLSFRALSGKDRLKSRRQMHYQLIYTIWFLICTGACLIAEYKLVRHNRSGTIVSICILGTLVASVPFSLCCVWNSVMFYNETV